MDCLAIQNLL